MADPPEQSDDTPADGSAGPTEAAVAYAANPASAVFASPSVRRFAREIGVPIRQVRGSGPDGRVSEQDVKDHARRATAQPAPNAPPAEPVEAPLPDFSRLGPVDRVTMSTVRRVTAEHISRCWRIVPHVTVHQKADITHLDRLRREHNARVGPEGPRLTVTAFLLKAAAEALKAFPSVNSSVDPAARQIVLKRYYNIGVAVDTERGLLVPVLRGVDGKSITQLAAELATLADRARAGPKKLSPDELAGGTFTITNLGPLGTADFSPIVNWPEAAILGVGRAVTEPVWRDGTFVPRLMLPLSLSIDHRVIDGADGARFLQRVVESLESPLLSAMGG